MSDSDLIHLSWKCVLAGFLSLLVISGTHTKGTTHEFSSSKKLAAFHLVTLKVYLNPPETNGTSPFPDCGSTLCFPVFTENLTVALLIVAAILQLYPKLLLPNLVPEPIEMVVCIMHYQEVKTQTPFRLVKAGLCSSPAADNSHHRVKAVESAAMRKRLTKMNMNAKAKVMQLQSCAVSKEKMVGFLLARRKVGEKELGEIKSVRDQERLLLEKQREENRCLNSAIMKRMDQLGRWYDRT